MLQISFNYHTDTNTVENLVVKYCRKCTDDTEPIVKVEENKLVITPKAVTMLECVSGDRISVQYIQENNEVTFPVICRSSALLDEEAGNKLTKNNTVSFRGFQRDLLLRYGTVFILEEYQNGLFKLVNKDNNSFDIQKVF